MFHLKTWVVLFPDFISCSPKLSSLFFLKQLKRGAKVIKDFGKNFALCMHDSLITTSIQNIVNFFNE
jgi:hypothetical protein